MKVHRVRNTDDDKIAVYMDGIVVYFSQPPVPSLMSVRINADIDSSTRIPIAWLTRIEKGIETAEKEIEQLYGECETMKIDMTP